MSAPIGLKELIDQIKRELLERPDAFDPEPLLSIDEIELEIGVSVTGKADAGFNIQVVQFGGGVERADVHTVRVKLSPLLSHEERLAALRKDPRWERMLDQQARSTFKAIEQAPPAPDEFQVN